MASSEDLSDYLLRCPTCGMVYRLSCPTYHGGGVHGGGTETPIAHDEAVALVLKGAVSAGTCDTCYAQEVEGTVRMGDEAH